MGGWIPPKSRGVRPDPVAPEVLAARRASEIAFHDANRDFMLRFQADHGDKVSANLIEPPPQKRTRFENEHMHA